MTLVWSIIITILFILSFIGLIYPVIPSVLLIWGGFFIYHFLINSNELGFWFYSIMVGLTVILFVADLIFNNFFLDKTNTSKLGKIVGAISLIVGSFIYPPFGLLIVPFISVLLVELSQRKTLKEASYSSLGTLFGFLSSSLAKALLQVMMIVLFIIWIL
ncbi:hypothetical protein CIB95_00475 [Lottiidibacillus patelloidae]|uniref:DUF456 domain-containing protein n=1 Tax=Lottiidibacillus patelloidae TaxID=2670334 RepID=A0A263BWH5_9BACI|nr:DUF456 domain-containing protein [Lottiidibacillus patelloidae]OZM58089.1 hypothetical protein CIB95_00475 [Lottiidibacillus patelloidae]